MERKTKHRVVGIIVVVALVFLLLQFMHITRDILPETPINSIPTLSSQKEIIPISSDVTEEESPPIVVNDHSLTPQHSVSLADDDSDSGNVGEINENKKTSITTKTEDIDNVLKELSMQKTTSRQAKKIHEEEVSQSRKLFAEDKNNVQPGSNVRGVRTKAPIVRDNGLFDIKMPVWVIQVGTFNTKSKAMQLKNQLQSAHYAAFSQQIQTVNGLNYVVLVGPQLDIKHTRALVEDLREHYHLNGMIIRYQTMTPS